MAAEAEFDPFTPLGKRSIAMAPIKLRIKAVRRAKREFREARRRVARMKNKRRVSQPYVRTLRL